MDDVIMVAFPFGNHVEFNLLWSIYICTHNVVVWYEYCFEVFSISRTPQDLDELKFTIVSSESCGAHDMDPCGMQFISNNINIWTWIHFALQISIEWPSFAYCNWWLELNELMKWKNFFYKI